MCFPLGTIAWILILIVIAAAVIGILNLLVPYIVRRLGIALGEGWGVIVGAVRIVCWALVAIAVILVCVELISCLLSFASSGLPRMR